MSLPAPSPSSPWRGDASVRRRTLTRAELEIGLSLVAVVVVLALSIVRMTRYINFVDEATYLSIAYRFALGDVPVHDEYNLVQTATLLAWPLMKAFLAVTGSADGIVLFMRACYVAFISGVAAVVFRSSRRYLGTLSAALVALLCLGYLLHAHYAFGHYTVGGMGWALGAFTLLPILDGTRSRRWLFAVGVAHGLAMLGHGSYLLPSACLGALLLCFGPGGRERWRGFALYVLGGLLVGLVAALVFSLKDFPAMWKHVSEIGFGQRSYLKINGPLGEYLRNFTGRRYLALAVLAGITYALRHRRRLLAGLLVLSLPAAALALPQEVFFGFAILPAFLALALYPRDRFLRNLVVFFAVPTLVAVLSVSAASVAGFLRCAALPPLLASATAAVYAFRRAGEGREPAMPRLELGVFAGLALLTFLINSNFRLGWPVHHEKHSVPMSGPYRGIKTQPLTHALLTQMTTDLRAHADPRGRLLIYPFFPNGYLMTAMRPLTPTIWFWWEYPPMPAKAAEEFLQFVRERRSPFDLLLLAKVTMVDERGWSTEIPPRDQVLDALLPGAKPLVTRPEYELYRLP